MAVTSLHSTGRNDFRNPRRPRALITNTEENGDTRVGETRRLLALSGSFEDLPSHHPEDDVYDELYTSAAPSQDWRSKRPHFLKSLAESAWVVVRATFLGGILLGLSAVALFYVDINTANYCHWVANKALSRHQLSVRVSGKALEGFIIEYWQFLILWFIFGWQLMKELNLLTVAVLVAFVDVSYHLLLHVFHHFKKPWYPYPLNVFFVFMTLYSSHVVGRRKFSQSKLDALKLTCKLCAQFLFGIPVSFLFNYVAFPWFAETSPGLKRMAVAAIAPMLMIPGKLISRQCALHLPSDVCHPGNAHAVVSVIYGGSTIVFRTLQAGIESFPLFVGLSIGSGVLYIIERLTVPLRDKWLARLGWSCCFGSRGAQSCSVQASLNDPRYRRLTADMTIQGILFESMSIVFSTTVLHVYYMMYVISAPKWKRFAVEVAQKVLVALLIETVSNSIAVLLQVRYFNVPIVRVWRRKWKKHVTLTSITTTLSTVYFTCYMLQFIRAVYINNKDINDADFNITSNCTEPFHFAGPGQ